MKLPRHLAVREGEIAVNGLRGKVKAVAIGKLPAVDWNMFCEFVCPAVFLLMEDGPVEWFLANPLSYGWDAYDSRGAVPWLTEVVSPAFESDGEGFGDMTVYAADSRGVRFDLRPLCNSMMLFNTLWICGRRGVVL